VKYTPGSKDVPERLIVRTVSRESATLLVTTQRATNVSVGRLVRGLEALERHVIVSLFSASGV